MVIFIYSYFSVITEYEGTGGKYITYRSSLILHVFIQRNKHTFHVSVDVGR